MKVKIINRSGNPLPEYATLLAAGMDMRANNEEPITLHPLERALVPTGLVFDIPEGFEVQVRPRSGLAARHGVTVLNSPGTVDSDYRGEIKAILVNLGPEPFTLRRGDRIAQIIVSPVTQAQFEPVDEVGETARGSGGFGSTGAA